MLSRPIRGAWIEIEYRNYTKMINESRPIRGAWIEIVLFILIPFFYKSRPIRGAWIEILSIGFHSDSLKVAPHTGRVD